MYPNHEDFAVRALGVPGLGALGVCFGPGIVMDSPKARPRGQFNWASTLWHEFAHVITLGMTDHHVPRWFSEGISVMEEHRAMPGWGDRLGLQTLKFIQQGKLLPIRELNGGFLRPRFPGQVGLSYFQAGKACEFIEARFGFSRILAMLESFKRKTSLEDALRQVLDLSPEDFDRQFQDYLESILGAALEHVDFQLLENKELMNSPGRLEALLAEQPHNFLPTSKWRDIIESAEKRTQPFPCWAAPSRCFPPMRVRTVLTANSAGFTGNAARTRQPSMNFGSSPTSMEPTWSR